MKNVLFSSNLKKLTSEGNKIKKYCDGDGLYFWVYESGKKVWYFRYSLNGKAREKYIGTFPAISLADAREKAIEYKKQLALKKDPIEQDKLAKISEHTSTFEKLAKDWWNTQLINRSEEHKKRLWNMLQYNVLQYIGNKPSNDITTQDILICMRKIEERGAYEIAHRSLGKCSAIFQYGIALGVCDKNPALGLNKVLVPTKNGHFAAPTEPQKVGEILSVIDDFVYSPITKIALKMLPYVFVRPNELVSMKWKDLDFEANEWRFTSSKTHVPQIVPLAVQVVKMLKDLQYYTGNREYCFTVTSTDHINANALTAAYRRMGLGKEEVTAHGWRATARTLLDEVLEYPPHIIEQQLAHKVKDPLGRAYNRTKHLEQRKKMMQDWADYLDKLKDDKI